MSFVLESATLRLQIDVKAERWSLGSKLEDHLGVSGAQSGLSYRLRGISTPLQMVWRSVEVEESLAVGVHGQLHIARLQLPPDAHGVSASLTFSLPAGHPLLLWQLRVENHSRTPLKLERMDLLRVTAPDGRLYFGRESPGELAFFSNGWQSWSFSGSYASSDLFRRTRLGPVRFPVEANPFSPQPTRSGHFTSEMFAVLGDRGTRSALLVGFLSQREHFGSIDARLDQLFPSLAMYASGDGARLDPGAAIISDWACLGFLNVDDPDPLGQYLDAVTRESEIRESRIESSKPHFPIQNPKPKIQNWTGWCSWYQYSEEDYTAAISAEDVSRNLKAMKALRPELPLQVCQIDDGFESRVGDWFSPAKGFPQGMAPLAAEIRDADCTPGLWLAPFIVDPRSNLADTHPDWLLRGRTNRPVNAGFFWNQFVTGLDLTHPEAMEYVRKVVSTAVHEWGYPYLKLDFLFAAALPGRFRDPTRNRAQVLRAGLEAVRQAAGAEATLVGCSCPLGPAIGLVDAMRIGADTNRRWYPSFKGVEAFFRDEASLPSAANALHNAITRAALHRRWWVNDPDCLLLRPDTLLTREEVISAATVIALSGGSLLLSDDLDKLPPERRWIAEVLLPLIGTRPQVPDWFDASFPSRMRVDLGNSTGEWSLLALFNWEDRPRDLVFKLSDYFSDRSPFPGEGHADEVYLRRFWQAEGLVSVQRLGAKAELELEAMPPHSVALFAARPVRRGEVQYLGSDLHISQGLEVSECEVSASAGSNMGKGGQVQLRLERPGGASGFVFIALPRPPQRFTLNGLPVPAQPCGWGCYAFSLKFVQSGDLIVEYS